MTNKYSPLKRKFEFLGVPKPNARNLAGGKAWKQPLDAMYEQLLKTEMFGNTYYASEEKRLELGVKVIADFVDQDVNKAASIAIEARNAFYMRTLPILATVFISTKDYEGFENLFNSVIRTPRDAIQFIDLCRAGLIRKGLGRKIKKTLGLLLESWLKRKGEFYATKYKNQLQTITKLTHPKIRSIILDYVMEKEGIEWLPESIIAVNEIKKKDLTEADVIDRIIKYRLDWNALKGVMKPTPAMWEVFLNNMSAIALIKNIATAQRHLGIDGTLEILRNRLTVDFLEKGKVLPIRLMQAYKMSPGLDIQRYLGMLANDYSRKYNMSNLGKVAICPDISGSMVDSYNKNFSYAEMAGMFAGVIARATKDPVLVPWCNYINLPSVKKETWQDVVWMYDTCRTASGGGTIMELPVLHLIQNHIEVDTFILLTDKEEWGQGWLQAWREYLQRVNRNAKAILIRSDAYIYHGPFPPEMATKFNIYQMYGYSDQVFKLLTQI